MRLCPCPLLIVKGERTAGYGTMTAAIDPLHRHAEPSGLDRAVLTVAHKIGHAFGVPWQVVHAFPDPASFPIVSTVEVLPRVFYGAENVQSVRHHAVQELVSEYGVTPVASISTPASRPRSLPRSSGNGAAPRSPSAPLRARVRRLGEPAVANGDGHDVGAAVRLCHAVLRGPLLR